MKLGVALPLAGDWATPENQILVAQRAEALGYHSLWVFQRLFYALAPQNDYPPLPNQPWPAGFRRVSDPIVTLAYVASATTKIRLGTSVLITADQGRRPRRRPRSRHAPHRQPRLLRGPRHGTGRGAPPALGLARRDPRGYRALRRGRPHRALPRQPGGAHLDKILAVMEHLAPKR